MSIDHSPFSADAQTDVLENARRVLTRERRELEDERAAFERLLDRLRDLETTRPTEVGSVRRAVSHTEGIAAVRSAYTETVMSVPHHLDRYDESFADHLAGELNEELAAAVTQGTHLHPQLKRSLIEATECAIDARETLLARIDAERGQLDRAEEALAELVDELASLTNQPLEALEFNALRLTRVRLHTLCDRCDELAARRQEFVRRQHRTLPGTDERFCSHLYGECETTRPVLSAIATLGDAIERALRRVERNLVTAT